MEYVAGGSLEDQVQRDGALSWQDAWRYAADVADGLKVVHAKGLVHRDIKPANLLWDADRDEVLLTDFGLAARLGWSNRPAGTPLFMAPESFAGAVTPPTDVYSLSATLFWLVTRQPPFLPVGSTSDEIVVELPRLIEQGLPTPEPRCAGLPEALEQLIRAGLAADPQQRPPLSTFAERLRGSLNHLLTDSLMILPVDTAPAASAGRQLRVSRATAHGYQPVAAEAPLPSPTRNMKKVPPAPPRMYLRTGDRVRIEVTADRDAFVTVFNVGPTGDFNLLYPEGPRPPAPQPDVRAGNVLTILDVEMAPPKGRERLAAIWSGRPLPLSEADLRRLAEGAAASQATRNMRRVQQALQTLASDERHTAVLELDHQE